MYSNPHAAVGLACTATTFFITKDLNQALWIGLPIAVISHWLMDFLREKGMSKTQVIKYDVIPSLVFYLPLFFIGFEYFWLFFLSWIAGNLLDLIDKKLYLTIFFPNKFKSTRYFHKHKTGLQLTNTQRTDQEIKDVIATEGYMAGNNVRILSSDTTLQQSDNVLIFDFQNIANSISSGSYKDVTLTIPVGLQNKRVKIIASYGALTLLGVRCSINFSYETGVTAMHFPSGELSNYIDFETGNNSVYQKTSDTADLIQTGTNQFYITNLTGNFSN